MEADGAYGGGVGTAWHGTAWAWHSTAQHSRQPLVSPSMGSMTAWAQNTCRGVPIPFSGLESACPHQHSPGEIAHAYIFVSPKSSGMHHVRMAFARTLAPHAAPKHTTTNPISSVA